MLWIMYCILKVSRKKEKFQVLISHPIFFSIFIEKNPCTSGPLKLKPVFRVSCVGPFSATLAVASETSLARIATSAHVTPFVTLPPLKPAPLLSPQERWKLISSVYSVYTSIWIFTRLPFIIRGTDEYFFINVRFPKEWNFDSCLYPSTYIVLWVGPNIWGSNILVFSKCTLS